MTDQTKHFKAMQAIKKKLQGKRLNYKEVYALMDEIAHDRMKDVVTAYFIAAGFKDGFTEEELYFLTKAMVETGTQISFDGIVADKHSIGGLSGTRASMIIVPIIASAGFKIPKTSSRAITSPAGTADVMELFAHVNLNPEQIQKVVNDVGGCITWGGHLGIAPADDVIISIEKELSFQFFDKIIMSIMAKKIAVGANHLVIDIPLGKTMKVKTEKEAETISKKFKGVARKFGMKIETEISRTYEPAGNGVGVYLEGMDVMRVLEQTKDRPIALEKRSLTLAGKLLDLCYQSTHEKKNGLEEAEKILLSGKALDKFSQIVKAQGGKTPSFDSMKMTSHSIKIESLVKGVVKDVDNLRLNALCKILGAPNDRKAGVFLHKKRKDSVEKKEVLFEMYSSSRYRLEEAQQTLEYFPFFDIQS